MVTLNRIYTRTGDGGRTRLSTGEEVDKYNPRVEAYGAVDETNACIGLARLHTKDDAVLDAILERVQNDLFDLGADLAAPERGAPLPWEALRILQGQVDRLEQELDSLNDQLDDLTSFVLPAGSPASAALHLARTVCRRAERTTVYLAQIEGETVSDAVVRYLNRLSDLLFVASRWCNDKGKADVLWKPGATR
ncbi:MAG: cob(I)yrinic acid a,c-diamide adenosyltransferase [Caulobacteraceae bacterium]|nr:cob(I)yrinic acid a,c-diamide adenosyltransferase [Caulobacteraceae bacterium]